MDILFWIIFFLPISKALKHLEEIKLFGNLGGSIVIKCPLKNLPQRLYLCRETRPNSCHTVVSSSGFVGKNFEDRVSLKVLPKENVFLVELRELKEDDEGNYACGMGYKTDRGKTQKVILTVTNDFYPFWEDPEFPELLPPPWAWISNEASSSRSTTQASSTSAPITQPQQAQTQPPPPTHPSPTNPALLLRNTLAAAAPSQTFSSTVASKTPRLGRLLRAPTVSYPHHTRLQSESASYFGSPLKKDGGFHILILATLGMFLMMLLGLVLGRTLQKRRALSKRINRLTIRMSALEASSRAHSHLYHSYLRSLHRPVSNRPRSQQNIYSACPRQVQGPDQNGEQISARDPEIPEHSTTTQVSRMAQLQAPVPVNNEYGSTYYLGLAEPEDVDSHDYINVSCLPQLPNSPPDLGFHANQTYC
ncbi:fas apoptotic inhibitory molecule 3 [Gracilinanus agilis]|uniref:fas apoptotic inhibitory molecule 3 n=1 Tax=Gracilinanus agilis TaxID=191870 RepID=UPI001CFD8B36|nr:fas apoptotic inhibitory molecule 3 [Gracilinanus agilis]